MTVPYSLNPQEGTLGYDKYITTFWSGNEARNAMLVDFWVQNDYKTPLAISRVELQPLAPKQKNKVRFSFVLAHAFGPLALGSRKLNPESVPDFG